MLPSNGYFSAIKCPFFSSSKEQCTRPYCHFRHVKEDSDDSSDEGTSSKTDAEFPKDGENQKLLAGLECLSPESKVQESPGARAHTFASEAAQSNSKITSQNPYMPAIPPPTYTPTPIAVLKSAHLPIPYTPLVVSRIPTAKKKNRQEYVPHSVGEKPYFPPYSPASTTIPTTPRINNTLYEIYGPEGAQFSPNDAEPSGTGYSYSSADYNPGNADSSSSVPSKKARTVPDPSFSPPDSPPPSPPSSPPSSPPPSPKSPTPSPLSADLDLSELDKLELEYESEPEERPPSRTQVLPSSPEKRKRTESSSGSESKKQKVNHSEKEKNGHVESEKKSSSKSEKKDRTSSSSSKSRSHKSSSSSSNHRRSSSSSDKKKDRSKEHSEKDKRSHKEKSESRNKSSSGSTTSDRHREKSRESSQDKHKSRSKDSGRERDRHKSKDKHDKNSRRSSNSSCSSGSKNKLALIEQKEELKRAEADLDADLEDADFIEQQCLELFSEYDEVSRVSESASKEDPRVSSGTPSEDTTTPVISSKKRIAHSSASNVPVPSVRPTPAPKIDLHSVMKERFDKVAASKPVLVAPKPYSATNPLPLTTTAAPVKRIIRSVPNVAMLLKPPVPPTTTHTAPANRVLDPETQRVDEYGRVVKARVAHAPSPVVQAARKPMINPGDCRKFKASTRQAFVDKLFEAYKNAGFGDASHDMALDSERECAQGTDSVNVYSHRIIQLLREMRTVAEKARIDVRSDSMTGVGNRKVSHTAVLAGKRGASVSWSIEKAKKRADVTEDPMSLYDNLFMYVLSKEQLEANGFPMASDEKGVALLKKNSFRSVEQPSVPNERICVRCLKRYSINKHGEQTTQEECLHHWGRRITVRRFREAESKYTCCDTLDQGCTVASGHVYEPNESRRAGFMSTLSKPDDDPGIYALDCEMCYTTGGLELTRVTVVKSDLSVVYETLVKPKNRIIDYNTRYSGLTEEDMEGARTSLLQVQATLLNMFSDKTILIGHSLESDMKALKLIHPTVVDTSVVFPHKMGAPYKKALRTLAADYLKKIIQNDVNGHDSKEDAVTAMELMLWKVKEDAKLR